VSPSTAYLTWTFDGLGTHREVFAMSIEQLTPDACECTLR
jgi:hypothetical protein